MTWYEKLQKLKPDTNWNEASRQIKLDDVQYLSKAFLRHQMPAADIGVKIANHFGVQSDWLFNDALGFPSVVGMLIDADDPESRDAVRRARVAIQAALNLDESPRPRPRKDAK